MIIGLTDGVRTCMVHHVSNRSLHGAISGPFASFWLSCFLYGPANVAGWSINPMAAFRNPSRGGGCFVLRSLNDHPVNEQRSKWPEIGGFGERRQVIDFPVLSKPMFEKFGTHRELDRP